MKLVTGIEAIQSGKPWRHKSERYFVEMDTPIKFTTAQLLKKEFELKEEPREFWINVKTMTAHDIVAGQTPIGSDWIRVREIEK